MGLLALNTDVIEGMEGATFFWAGGFAGLRGTVLGCGGDHVGVLHPEGCCDVTGRHLLFIWACNRFLLNWECSFQ